MANRRATIYKYVRVGNTWRYARSARGPNGKLKPHWVHVGKTIEHQFTVIRVRPVES